MDIKGKKRERNANFSREETEKLVSLVEAYKNIIENKKSDAVTWQEKEKAWKAIETEFNSSISETFRDAKHLKLKYEALKRDTRKKCSIIRAERNKTGGDVSGAPPLTLIELKIKEIISLSDEGDESVYDSDPLDVGANEEFYVFHDEGTIQPVKSEEPMADIGTADYSIISYAEVPAKSNLKRPLEEGNDPVASTSRQMDLNLNNMPQKKWGEWKSLNSKKPPHPALCRPRVKRSFDKLAEEKLELVQLQKQLIEEELEEMRIKKQMMNNEMQHKCEIYKLEREERLLKIEILKTELENKKKVIK